MTLIILDAGHGPDTPGKRTPDGKMREFHFNSAVAALTGDFLTKEGVTVRFAHESSRDVPLSERTALANRLQADAFVSIHANAFGSGWSTAQGIETFIYPQASTSSAALASSVQKALISACRRPDRGVKKADFAVLRDTTMPAILAECGFMSHQTEAALLQNKTYQLQCARAIAFGILCWDYGR
ncbi:N-acetylmuramoyl-L-alanine amidase [Sporosarcina sp. P37]|uniref:N-acetylmuramoyl-L-alanine amidase n=1 Tax=unclassified Sporosarcina TaxID=2647733 RepID=UPI0009C30C77|nr:MULTISPECIES: N-acetylmuramoyl-L-alanine amidase [unclassified Sporosarcina]ARD47643.1 cell wall hydrolase [Sporosarcina sp. P33]ARK24173.1 N-acetylmuramoyl-L-alanine amidase [Sporosarcina sp. P37]PID17408.1 N-acetylmuramoyl-L-alanine amidase [Sporosarcina sp. P35]